MMIGTDGRCALTCLHTSRPLIRGIMTSSTTRSGSSANDTLQARHAVVGADDLVTLVFEVVAQAGHHRGLVFDDQDARLAARRLVRIAPTQRQRAAHSTVVRTAGPLSGEPRSYLLHRRIPSGCVAGLLLRGGERQRQRERAALPRGCSRPRPRRRARGRCGGPATGPDRCPWCCAPADRRRGRTSRRSSPARFARCRCRGPPLRASGRRRVRYSLTPMNFSRSEYFSALLTRLTSERAMASRSTLTGGRVRSMFCSNVKPCSSI